MEKDVARHRLHLMLVPLCLALASCGGDSEEATFALEDADALAFVYANKPATPVIVVYKSGEALTILSEDGDRTASGAVFSSPGLDPLVVEAAGDGLPTRAYVSGHTFIFRNWRQTTVDVGIVRPSGVTEALRDADWPDDGVSPTFSNGSASVASVVRDGHNLISAGACVIAGPAPSLAEGVTFPSVEAACARLAAKTAVVLLEEDGQSSPWQEALELADSALVAAGCAIPRSATATDCVGVVLSEARDVATEADDVAEAATEALEQVVKTLGPQPWTGAELIATLSGHPGYVNKLAFSPDGNILASGGENTTKLWDVEAQQEMATLEVPNSRGYVAFSPGGSTLAIDNKNYVTLWDVNAREQITRLGPPMWVSAIAFSPDGKTLAIGDGWDAFVTLWDAQSGKEIATLEEHTFSISALTFSPDGATLAVANYMWDPLRLWDVGTREQVATLRGHADNVPSIAFSRDGRLLASGSDDGTAKLWSVAGQHEVAALDDGRNLFDRDGAIYAIAFSPDGLTLATGVRDGLVKLWDTTTYREIATLTGHRVSVASVAFAPDGTTLATCGWDDDIRLWRRTP